MIQRLKVDDPVRGTWEAAVDGDINVWCDTSSLAMGVMLEMSSSGQECIVAV